MWLGRAKRAPATCTKTCPRPPERGQCKERKKLKQGRRLGGGLKSVLGGKFEGEEKLMGPQGVRLEGTSTEGSCSRYASGNARSSTSRSSSGTTVRLGFVVPRKVGTWDWRQSCNQLVELVGQLVVTSCQPDFERKSFDRN